MRAHTRSAPGGGGGGGSFSTGRPISPSSPNNVNDALKLKNSLNKLGYYPTPKEGMQGFADNQMFDGVKAFQKKHGLAVDGVVKPGGETERKINQKLSERKTSGRLDKAAYASAGAMRGLSLGFSDEIEGAAGGLGCGVASLNPKWNKDNESFSEAAKRGYAEYRDNRRGHIREGCKTAPALMTASEAAGAVGSPAGLAFKASKAAPLAVKARKNLMEAIAAGTAYGIGVSDGSNTKLTVITNLSTTL